MKKSFLLVVAVLATMMSAKAEGVEFAYEAGAELVSSYLWRGQYLGGLSFQPTLTLGFESEHIKFQGGVWGSVGASDWGFRKGLEQEEGYNPNTYFVPEIDVTLSFESHGFSLGVTHYYYCDGGNFFGWKPVSKWTGNYTSTSTTELNVGFNCDEFMPEGHHLYFNWNTMLAGADFKYLYNEETDEETIKQNYSSYFELGYDYTFESIGLTLGAQVGFVPWASADIYYNEKFAVQNVSLKINKAWEFDKCELDLFAQGMVNPSQLSNDKETWFIKASGDDKIGCQSVNGTIGLGIWF